MSENIPPTAVQGSGPVRGDSSTGDLSNAQVGTPKAGGVSPTDIISPQSFIQSETKSYFYPILIIIIFLATLGVGSFFFVRAQTLTRQLTTLKPSPTTPTPIVSPAQTSYTCPKTEWVDCEPGSDVEIKLECTTEYLSWAQINCPGFKGAAL